MSRRPWYSGMVIVGSTVLRTLGMLRRHRLGVLIPFVLLLFATAIILYAVNSISPLAPFVYSLF